MASSFAGRLGVTILAAGASRRMGKPKMLLPWGKTSVLGQAIELWRELGCGQIAVVCASGSPVTGELDRLAFPMEDRVINPDPDRGMFSSIQCAAQWKGWKDALTHRAIALGDQPHLDRKILGQFLSFSSVHSDRVCQPSRAGHGRHPIVMPSSIFAALATASAVDLRAFLRAIEVMRCEIDDPALELDLDLPEDYEQAVKRYLR